MKLNLLELNENGYMWHSGWNKFSFDVPPVLPTSAPPKLRVSTNLMQICYRQDTWVEKKKLTGCNGFWKTLLNHPPTLPPSRPLCVYTFHPPQKGIFTYAFRHLKVLFRINLRCQTPFFFNVYNSNKQHRLGKKTEEKIMACLMMIACRMPFLKATSFDAGFAAPGPPRGLGPLECLLGDSVWPIWA